MKYSNHPLLIYALVAFSIGQSAAFSPSHHPKARTAGNSFLNILDHEDSIVVSGKNSRCRINSSARNLPPLFATAISGKFKAKKKNFLKKLAIKTFSNFQLFLITHPNFLTKFLASICYVIDFAMYSAGGIDGPKRFLSSRQEILGKNFAVLGRILVTDYEESVALLTAPQKRGPYLGRARLNPSRCPMKFLLFLDDKEAGGTDLHSQLHLGIWETVAPAAMERITADSSGAFKNYLKEGKEKVLAAKDPAEKELQIFHMTIRYLWHALFGAAIPSQKYVEMVYTRFKGMAISEFFVIGATMPFSVLIGPFQFAARKNEKELVGLIMEAPYMQTYEPKEKYGNVPKEEWAQLLLAISGLAGVLGTSTLNCNVEKFAITADINTKDAKEVTNAILESCRIRAPVNNINTIIPEEKTLMVNGNMVNLPKNSLVASSIGAASLDEEEFPDPLTFNHKRGNLVDSVLNFNHHGWDPDTVGTRVCPGRQVAMKIASDWLILMKDE